MTKAAAIRLVPDEPEPVIGSLDGIYEGVAKHIFCGDEPIGFLNPHGGRWVGLDINYIIIGIFVSKSAGAIALAERKAVRKTGGF
jgi:hypothetical protein